MFQSRFAADTLHLLQSKTKQQVSLLLAHPALI
jgi:hypothetical protein